MFTRSARIYDAVYAWKDYPREAALVHELVQARRPGAATLLDVACGTGAHLAELRRWYRCEGLDLDPNLLAVARERLPDVPLHEGDMRDFELGRRFDAVTCLLSPAECSSWSRGCGRRPSWRRTSAPSSSTSPS